MVYVVQDNPNVNIIPALRYGEIVVLLEPGQVMFSPGPVVHELNQKLNKFSDDDYILCMGDPSAIGVSCAVASRWNNGRIKILKWDRMEKDYYPISFDIH